jgi:predicted negative regulator of RcsB-dependent stress response
MLNTIFAMIAAGVLIALLAYFTWDTYQEYRRHK